jgi:sporulation integral membrane protein YtvI
VGQALGEVPAKLSAKLLSFMALAAAKAPAALLFAVTAVIGTYFLSASYPQVKLFLSRQLSENVRAKAGRVKVLLRTTIGRYFRAQLIMTAIVFVFLGVAFALLKINYALLLSLLTAVIDALPVLGTGTVLIPWALYELLTGNVGLGLGLGITYAVVTVLRSCIQAKLLGDQLGLHPLSTLLAIYVGYSFAGVWGMIIFPILAITVKQLNDAGLVKLWKTSEEEKHDRGNIEYSGRHGNEHSGRNEYPSR